MQPHQVRPHMPGPGYICRVCELPHLPGCIRDRDESFKCVNVPPPATPGTTAEPAITTTATEGQQTLVTIAPAVCAKCREPFTAERPQLIVGDEACGYWKPCFSVHRECLTIIGNSASTPAPAPEAGELRKLLEDYAEAVEHNGAVRGKDDLSAYHEDAAVDEARPLAAVVAYVAGLTTALAAARAQIEQAQRVHLDRHNRLSDALGVDPGYSADATVDLAVSRIRAENAVAWPPRDVVERLVCAADHLLLDHDCDQHGYEETTAAVKAARVFLAAALPGDTNG